MGAHRKQAVVFPERKERSSQLPAEGDRRSHVSCGLKDKNESAVPGLGGLWVEGLPVRTPDSVAASSNPHRTP